MLGILCFIVGVLVLTLAALTGFFAYIIYNDSDGDYYCNTLYDWIKKHQDKKWTSWAHLKFNDWKKYYILAPDEWDLIWFAPKRTIRNKKGYWDMIYINFGFIGNIRYVFFKYNMKNKRKKDEITKNSQDNLRYILEAVQGDINNLQKQAEKEINQARKETDRVRKSYLNKKVNTKTINKQEM